MQLTRAGNTAIRRRRLTRMSVGLLVTAPGGLELTKLLRVAVQPPKDTRGKH